MSGTGARCRIRAPKRERIIAVTQPKYARTEIRCDPSGKSDRENGPEWRRCRDLLGDDHVIQGSGNVIHADRSTQPRFRKLLCCNKENERAKTSFLLRRDSCQLNGGFPKLEIVSNALLEIRHRAGCRDNPDAVQFDLHFRR